MMDQIGTKVFQGDTLRQTGRPVPEFINSNGFPIENGFNYDLTVPYYILYDFDMLYILDILRFAISYITFGPEKQWITMLSNLDNGIYFC